ncbi:Protease Do-like 8, chloroplastic [Vitis vinifera]|uniref:Protease Do-like 8, chloroplastic n=1 Tax=Vitis vinifera TaxID=29760 RepID=A0A438HE06_VITVI|nr:Protease Do-like 8, chloroplastic [Vitis vinifera]
MQILACSLPLQSHRIMGRREVCFDGISNACSPTACLNDAVSSNSIPRPVDDQTKDLGVVIRKNIPLTTRRTLFASLLMYSWYHPSRYLSGSPGGQGEYWEVWSHQHSEVWVPMESPKGLAMEGSSGLLLISGLVGCTAHALGDPSVTIEEVTPPVSPSGPLFPTEERIVQLFERNTYSVVNIFDVTLRPQLNVTGAVEIVAKQMILKCIYQVPEGNGSGVVWDEQGHIVTNYHVIGNALSRNSKPGQVVARVNILASDGVQKNFEGKLIGADRTKDLAVLKIEASEDLLRPMKVGQSSYLRVGQQCLAIGNPFGFDHTLTVGVISGLNRDIFSQTGVTIGGGIQTDAAINPGNSGGPLLDSKGNLIGINTAIFTQTGTSAGVGFAIPSSTVLKIVPQLIQYGKVVRAGLNADIAPDLVANQLNVRNGALVLLVPGDSLAAKAGLLPTTRGFAGNIMLGDIIVAVDNKPVSCH